MTAWAEDEAADGSLGAVALLRAAVEGRQDNIDAILGSAGERETRAIAEVLLGIASDALIRWTCTAAAVTDRQDMLEAALSADTAVLMAEPEIRAHVEVSIASVQGDIINGG
jgi:hypothetical protein